MALRAAILWQNLVAKHVRSLVRTKSALSRTGRSLSKAGIVAEGFLCPLAKELKGNLSTLDRAIEVAMAIVIAKL